MKHLTWGSALLAFAITSFSQQVTAQDGSSKRGRSVEITSEHASVYEENGKQKCEFVKPSVTLFRPNADGTKIKESTLSADRGQAVSKPGRNVGKITLQGNVHISVVQGGVINADEAEIDPGEESIRLTGNVKLAFPEK